MLPFENRCWLLLAFLFLYAIKARAQAPANDNCSGAITITSNTTTTWSATYTVLNATSSGSSASCLSNPSNDVWFRFQAVQNNATVQLGSMGTGNRDFGRSDPTIAVFIAADGTCSSLSEVDCHMQTSNSASLTRVVPASLIPGRFYYIRVSSGPNPTLTNGNFQIAVTHTLPPAPPANDDCVNAVLLVPGAAPTTGTVYGATASSGTAACAGNADDDVWFRFTASAPNTNITAGFPSGSLLNASNTQLQLLSGTCGALPNVACGLGSIATTNLVPGATYFLRVFGSGAGTVGTNTAGGAFNISVAVPAVLPASGVVAGRQNEVFQLQNLSPANALADPWEITYGQDGMLWITEAKGYKLHRMDPATGTRTVVLDVSQNATFLPAADRGFNVLFSASQSPWPQGGFAGMALHPLFMDPVNPRNFVYVSYVHSYQGLVNGAGNGQFFTNRVVRFTYNTATGRCESPVSLCDTLPGSNDHNSQRMIVAPVNGTYYLFYASGDMGSGQFDNANRAIKSLVDASYEGKILRFNLEPDEDAGVLDRWIPNDNPLNGARQSAVWATGMRNNQGFAFASINGTDYLFGSSHGPFSDDEINIIERAGNYGHPNVIGFAADNNYNNTKAGTATGSLPLITNEAANAAALGASYRDPIFSAYAASNSRVVSIYNNQTNNGAWPSEGWSGMDIYTNSIIPGWRNSLVIGSLKWGRVLRLKLNAAGNGVVPTDGQDTVGYFGSQNRFRDVAIGPNGRELYVVMDRSTTTSGPTAANPVVSACAGCVQKYTFLGYQSTSAGKSMIPSAVEISTGTAGSCITASTITIDNTNNNLWVPITGPDGNILAEIRANGNNLGLVQSAVYYHSGTMRQQPSGNLYGNRSLAITPQVQPATPVSIRLYLTNAEFNAMKVAVNTQGRTSGITTEADLVVLKNDDPCGAALTGAASVVVPQFAEPHGTGGYVLQANISSFSSFYFAGSEMTTLPLKLVTFNGTWQNKGAELQWRTAGEYNTSHFVVERSTGGSAFVAVAQVPAGENGSHAYSFTDVQAGQLGGKVLYYRLKMLDKDGAFTFSNTISLAQRNFDAVTIYPNPASQTLNIRLPVLREDNVRLLVTDLNGNLLLSRRLGAGAVHVAVDVKQWKPQLYVIRIVNSRGVEVAVQKFQKI